MQLDGANSDPSVRVFVLAATNRPWEIDDAIMRRLSKKIYIPLPDVETRKQLIGEFAVLLYQWRGLPRTSCGHSSVPC